MRLAADVVKAGARTDLYGHACEVEASVGLYLAPQSVKAERVAGAVRAYAHAHTDIKAAARLDYPFLFEEFTENGALGDARLASVEFGERIVETTLARAMEFLESFMSDG
ncbi:MAG TPA: creatininase family protein, partial [Anaerolineae bacterium]